MIWHAKPVMDNLIMMQAIKIAIHVMMKIVLNAVEKVNVMLVQLVLLLLVILFANLTANKVEFGVNNAVLALQQIVPNAKMDII